MSTPNNHAMMQLLANMQHVEQLRAQNAAAAQNLASTLQRLGAGGLPPGSLPSTGMHSGGIASGGMAPSGMSHGGLSPSDHFGGMPPSGGMPPGGMPAGALAAGGLGASSMGAGGLGPMGSMGPSGLGARGGLGPSMGAGGGLGVGAPGAMAQVQAAASQTQARDVFNQQRLALVQAVLNGPQPGDQASGSPGGVGATSAPSVASASPASLAAAAAAAASARAKISGASGGAALSAPLGATLSAPLGGNSARGGALGSAESLPTALQGALGRSLSSPDTPAPPPIRRAEKASAFSASKSDGAEDQEPSVPRCHLHRKQNKACKFCKAFYSAQEEKSKRVEEARLAAIEKLKEGDAAKVGKGLGENDKAPLPNFPLFPPVLLEKIQKSDLYNSHVVNAGVADVKAMVAKAESCDASSRSDKSLDAEVSLFVCCIYRTLAIHLTEGQLQGFLFNRSPFARCIGFLYVRLGMHHERYVELLTDGLIDTEEFVPFPGLSGRGSEAMSIGQFVENLLTKDKYCDMSLPRIPVASRKSIHRRMVMSGQIRRRYMANLEVLDRYKESGVRVEVCTHDGEWAKADTIEVPSSTWARKTVLVRIVATGEEREVSMGCVICPGARGSSSRGGDDLTRDRGRSAEELLEKFEAQHKDSAVANGKDYCKTSGQHTLRVGVPFVAGVKRKDMDDVRPRIEEDLLSKPSGPSMEHRAKMAAIESKYCARVGSSQGKSDHNMEGPDRMRLG